MMSIKMDKLIDVLYRTLLIVVYTNDILDTSDTIISTVGTLVFILRQEV